MTERTGEHFNYLDVELDDARLEFDVRSGRVRITERKPYDWAVRFAGITPDQAMAFASSLITAANEARGIPTPDAMRSRPVAKVEGDDGPTKYYTERERDLYERPNCPGCGRPVDQGWEDVTMSADLPRRMYVLGRWSCHTPGCRYNPASGR